MLKQIIIALKVLLIMTILTGIIYPLFVYGISQLAFPYNANGSLIKQNGIVIGSELVGQPFDSLTYFWPRPSSQGYNPIPSGGSNYGPTSKKLDSLISARRESFRNSNGLDDKVAIPNEMLCASASGLDPHISPEAARLQMNRIVKFRKLNDQQQKELCKLCNNLTEPPQFHLLGNERINVFILNLELDKIK
jgi:potassium-transporting ATPase KdpC subunit